MNWPEQMAIDEEYAVGDKRHWEVSYRVTESPMSPAEFIAHFSERARADESLEVIDPVSEKRTAWRYEYDHRGQWRLEFEIAEVVFSSEFVLQGKLRPVGS